MANMIFLSVIAVAAFLILSVASMDMKHAGDMHKMVMIDKKKLEQNDQTRTKREGDSLDEFCNKFDQTTELFHAGNIQSLEQLRSACSGHCAKCENCPGSCKRKVAKGCKGLLKDMPPTLKIHSPLQDNCRSFIN